MSTSLYWRPPPPQPDGEYLGYQLKFALREFFGHDGSLTSDWAEVGEDMVPFLQGVAAGGNDDTREEAGRLVELIRQHGKVEISLRS